LLSGDRPGLPPSTPEGAWCGGVGARLPVERPCPAWAGGRPGWTRRRVLPKQDARFGSAKHGGATCPGSPVANLSAPEGASRQGGGVPAGAVSLRGPSSAARLGGGCGREAVWRQAPSSPPSPCPAGTHGESPVGGVRTRRRDGVPPSGATAHSPEGEGASLRLTLVGRVRFRSRVAAFGLRQRSPVRFGIR